MENNNGRGIFYGVIGVATLVVAIIGATFAYFSASAANNNAINVGATTLYLDIEGEETNYYSDMIPVESTNQYFKLYPGLQPKDETHTGQGTCTDDRGNSICGVYQFTITNPSATVAQTVNGSLTVVNNSFPIMTETSKSNIHYAVFKGTAAQVAGSTNKFDVTQQATKNVTAAANGDIIVAKTALGAKDDSNSWTNTSQLLAPKASQTYTLVVWLEENGSKNSGDQGKLFSASIKFDTGSGSGVTGTLSAGGAA